MSLMISVTMIASVTPTAIVATRTPNTTTALFTMYLILNV